MGRLWQPNFVGLLACGLLGLSSSNALSQQIQGFQGDFGPHGVIRIAQPSLSWEVWADKGQAITKIKMLVDGVEVPATYNPDTHQLDWTPDTPLTPGPHQVQCMALVEGLLKMKQAWTFNVPENLPPFQPESSAITRKIVDAVNQFRSDLGLPSDTINTSLLMAATAHSHYLALNHAFGHFENTEGTAFVGQNLDERFNAFGWAHGGYEDVGLEMAGEPDKIVADLYAAPYHRIPFMQPGDVKIGAADENHRETLDFSYSQDNALVLSPADRSIGQMGQWDGSEIPSPLRFWNAQGPVGFPVMVAGFGVENGIAKGEITLYDAQNHQVDCYSSNPATDPELKSALLAIPKQPLAVGTYSATARIVFDTGAVKEVTWSFSVGPKG